MAKFVTGAGPAAGRVLHPRAAGSRWVGFCFPVPAGSGNDQWDITTSLGQDLWLLSAKLILTATTAGAVINCCWRMVTCTAVPGSGGQVATELEPVVDVTWIGKPYGYYVGQDRELRFELNRYYSGAGRRFATWVQNDSAVVGIYVIACFQISEG